MADRQQLPALLLAWYDRHRRVLPWRALPGEAADPYRVWLSEIMLQQTTVAAVGPYFARFVERWPTIGALAAAPLDEVLHAWAGLGYYARARNLHKCAQHVAERLGGRFPDTEAGLRELPGVGPYTAAAIAAIAFDRKAAAVDGNAERVIARLYAVTEPLSAAKPALRSLASALVPETRAGDFAQALMDLGATVCTPRRPRCLLCPWAGACSAYAAGIAEQLPARQTKAERPTRRGTAFWVLNAKGEILLRRRAEDGLLGGMMEVPSTVWSDAEPADELPITAGWRELPGLVRHSFTHFHLELRVVAGRAGPDWTGAEGVWVAPDRLSDYALPSVMKKVVRHAFAHA